MKKPGEMSERLPIGSAPLQQRPVWTPGLDPTRCFAHGPTHVADLSVSASRQAMRASTSFRLTMTPTPSSYRANMNGAPSLPAAQGQQWVLGEGTPERDLLENGCAVKAPKSLIDTPQMKRMDYQEGQPPTHFCVTRKDSPRRDSPEAATGSQLATSQSDGAYAIYVPRRKKSCPRR